jgi:O-antigen ligase
MATRLKTLRRQPGGEGLFRSAGRRSWALLWGTDFRRTVSALTLVLLAVIFYFVLLRGPPLRLLQLSLFLAVFLVIISKPHIGVLTMALYRSFARGLNLEFLFRHIGFTVTKSIGLLTLIAFVAMIATKKLKPVLGHRTQIIFIYGLLLATLISAFAALHWKSVWTNVFQLVENVILYVIFVNLFAEAKWLFRYTWLIILSRLTACITGLASVALSGVIRAAGAVGNANGLAMVANYAGAMLLVLSLAATETKKKFLFLSGLGICLVTIIFTGSRGGLITIIVTLTYQLIKRRKKLLPYFLAACILIVAFTLIPEEYKIRQERWFGAVIAGETEEVLAGPRGFIYRSALDIFKSSPIIGVGPRTFGTIFQAEYAMEAKGAATRARAVHSGILEVLVSTGVVGFTFFLGLIIVTFRLYWQNARLCRRANLGQYLLLNDIYEALFVVTLVAGSFETILKGGQIFFISIAVAAVVNRAAVILGAAARSRTAAPLRPAEAAANLTRNDANPY